MGATNPDNQTLQGRLVQVPFLGEGIGSRVATYYSDLVDERDVESVLVFKRFPTGIEEIGDDLGGHASGLERPWIQTISRHAYRVLEELNNPPTILSNAERGVLMKRHLDAYAWSDLYLRRASRRESFDPDVSRFSVESTWQGLDIETDDPVLGDLVEMNDAFHSFLDEHGYLDRPALLSRAIEILQDEGVRERVQSEFDALLVFEFEEFTAIDRAYLARVALGKDLICIAERDSSIQRTWNEPGRIASHAPDLEIWTLNEESAESKPQAVASFLASGETDDTPENRHVSVIDAETHQEQIRIVADEIERLRRVESRSYNEFGVVLRDANAPIDSTVRLLRSASIPTTSATVSGLAHDPIARELYDVARYMRASNRDDRDEFRRRLDARLPGGTDEALHTVESDSGIARALWSWVIETGMKGRIADRESPLDARTQFQHVSDILDLARFVDETEAIESTWEWFCMGLEREFQRASSDKIATDLDVEGGGVLVDAVRVFKNVSRPVVFLLDVVEGEYPASPRFNSLFPKPHLKSLPEYPAFTTPTTVDVRETFPTVEGDVIDPFDAYYAELSRRLLAVGARAATERLYFGTYREEVGGTGRVTQPSRYLQAVEEALGMFDRVDHERIHSHGRAIEFALSRVDDAFETIRFAGVAEEPVSLDGIKTDFGAVQTILEAGPPDLERAVRTRVDFAEGRVRRE